MDLEKEILKLADKERAKNLQRFFKTGKGEYGEGDVFIGIVVPQLRKLCKEHWKDVSMEEIRKLVYSEVHEKRMLGLFILIEKYKLAEKLKDAHNGVSSAGVSPDGQKEQKKEIFEFYLKCAKDNKINNWDLVDLSCRDIVGAYLFDKDKEILYKLAKSTNLWEKRISIISTFYFIKNKQFEDTLNISKILLNDKHDLIHKAVGWALREVGNKSLKVEEDFLKENKRYKAMPRTMLRYAIEKFEEKTRKKYLKK
jgi:3-methyladenine DNA glycosylase AlkD